MVKRRTGIDPLAYMGVEPSTPAQFVQEVRNPTPNDYTGFIIGTVWMVRNTERVFILVDKRNQVATWIEFGGELEALTGDSGGRVEGDVNKNINILSGIPGLTVDGNPATNTLTINNTGAGGLLQTLSDDAGTLVFPDANGDIALLGTAGHITTTSNPGTNSIVWDVDASLADQYTTDAGVAVPVANNLNVFGAHNINTSGAGDTVTVAVNNTVTLGDLVSVVGADSITLTTGDITLTAGRVNLQNTNAAGTEGIIRYGGNRFIHNFGSVNTFVGENAGTLGLTVANAVFNTALGNSSMANLTDGASNTAVGAFAMAAVTTGTVNVAIGRSAALNLTTGTHNVAIGYQCMNAFTTGRDNVAIGTNAISDLLTGDDNISIGVNSGGSYVGAESDNILINNLGVVGETGIIRIGNDVASPDIPTQTKCFIAAIRGVTTDVNDAIPVLIDSDGQLGTSSPSYFAAYVQAQIVDWAGEGIPTQVVPFDVVLYNVGADYDNTTYTYTAPSDGLYQFSCTLTFEGMHDNCKNFAVFMRVGGTGAAVGLWALTRTNQAALYDDIWDAGVWRMNGMINIPLTAGDTVRVEADAGNALDVLARASLGIGNTVTPTATWFAGLKIV